MKSENSLNQYCRMINKNNLVKLSKEQLADILLGLIMKSRSLIKNPLVQLTEATPIVEDYLKQILEKNTVLKYYQLLKIDFSKMVHDKARNLVREEEEEGVFHSGVFANNKREPDQRFNYVSKRYIKLPFKMAAKKALINL